MKIKFGFPKHEPFTEHSGLTVTIPEDELYKNHCGKLNEKQTKNAGNHIFFSFKDTSFIRVKHML